MEFTISKPTLTTLRKIMNLIQRGRANSVGSKFIELTVLDANTLAYRLAAPDSTVWANGTLPITGGSKGQTQVECAVLDGMAGRFERDEDLAFKLVKHFLHLENKEARYKIKIGNERIPGLPPCTGRSMVVSGKLVKEMIAHGAVAATTEADAQALDSVRIAHDSGVLWVESLNRTCGVRALAQLGASAGDKLDVLLTRRVFGVFEALLDDGQIRLTFDDWHWKLEADYDAQQSAYLVTVVGTTTTLTLHEFQKFQDHYAPFPTPVSVPYLGLQGLIKKVNGIDPDLNNSTWTVGENLLRLSALQRDGNVTADVSLAIATNAPIQINYNVDVWRKIMPAFANAENVMICFVKGKPGWIYNEFGAFNVLAYVMPSH